MAIRPILRHTSQRLRMKSIKVKRVDRSIQALIDDMIETMRAAEGVGLAAPQIGVLLRVIVCEYREEESEDLHQRILINPEILAKEGEWMAEEGCLSIPGYVGTVPRAVKVTVRGKDRNGKDVRIKTDGTLAHILQHEIDHLDGVLYIDYLESLDELREVEPNRRRRRRPKTVDEEHASDAEDVDDTSSQDDDPVTMRNPDAEGGSAAPTGQPDPDLSPSARRYRSEKRAASTLCCFFGAAPCAR